MTRTDHIRTARIYLNEARSRARNPAQRGFCFVLLQWAANCRRRAMEAANVPQQVDMFRGVA